VTSSSPIESNGFSFSADSQAVQSATPYFAGNGTHYLVYLAGGSGDTFMQSNRSPFNLSSIDLGGWLNAASSSALTITGNQVGGTSVSSKVTFANNNFSTFALSGFTNLQSVNLGTVDGVAYVAVDNIVTAPVPEPETYALLLGGLGVLGAVARRRRYL
jgi:hypothetical protein